jgi:hypothetical protein
MLLKVSPFLLASALTALALPIAAQIAVVHPNRQTHQTYTAEIKTTQVQTLPNGTTITHEFTETVAQDSAGRHMSSSTHMRPDFGDEPVTHVNVHDPVASTDANWDSRTRKAVITKYPPKDQQHGCWANEAGMLRVSYGGGQSGPVSTPAVQPRVQRAQPKNESEDLGTTTIQGVEAIGRRTTTTIPAGQVGNDQPIVTTEESWWGTSLGLLLRSVRDDPRSGTMTHEVTNLSTSEPDPALFQPPEGYEVKVDELHQVVCSQ